MWPVCPHRAALLESLLSMESKELIWSYYIFLAFVELRYHFKTFTCFYSTYKRGTKQFVSQLLENRSTALPRLVYL